MIKESAIKRISDGKIWTGKRHSNCIHKIVVETGERPVSSEKFIQGFITDKDEFVDRKEAFIIASDCNQLLDRKDPWAYPTLMSEDLW